MEREVLRENFRRGGESKAGSGTRGRFEQMAVKKERKRERKKERRGIFGLLAQEARRRGRYVL